mmetsp:Transcript_30882/g.83671  ORF Transcript_30882/g.83671 Transcript_30882/m.83671 type:complete len:704 (-) Transcript_30882:97-2208(-)
MAACLAFQAAGLLLLLASPASAAVRGSVAASAPQPKGTTPVKKVIDLLKQLSAKVETEGKSEAAQYDKYACFCKEQADEKLYAIETSEKLINTLAAEIGDLKADIADLSSGISGLATKISGLEGSIKTAVDGRAAENAVYVGKEADTRGAIDALKRAIAAIRASKGQMSGKVALEKAAPALAQLRAAAVGAALSAAERRLLAAAGQPGEAYDYEFHANDILATLQALLVSFSDIKDRLDQEEFEAQSSFERKKLGLENEKKFAAKEKLEKEKLEAFKTERLQEASGEQLAEQGAKSADQAFMSTLTEQCEAKAKAWDDRSQTRAQEITAISKAMEALETGVAPNWQANRMLVGLQRGSRAPSFLQLRGSERHRRASGGAGRQQRVLALLDKAAGSLHSPVLSVAALRVRASEDHFEKVRSIIKDLVSKLEAQASAEATTKSFCDKEMAAAVTQRDAKAEEVESLTAQITEKEAKKAKLNAETAALSQAIADNFKALKEATELRTDEKKDNTGVMRDASEGKKAVEYALQVLKAFYSSQASSLVQRRGGYVPPNSDRAGKTVGDLAPEVFEGSYKGAQEGSKGIIGLLEVILADFDRTDQTVAAQEKLYAQEFQSFESAISTDTNAKEGDKSTKEGQVATLEDDLVRLADLKKDALQAHDLANSELEKLSAMCVEGEETYEERVAKREKEIAALKEAHAILENW